MTREKTVTDTDPGTESPVQSAESTSVAPDPNSEMHSPAESAPPASDPEPSVPSPVEVGGRAAHWLARVAERAGLKGEGSKIAPEKAAKEAWPVVTKAYDVSDSRLCELVATYFRLDVADFTARDPNAHLLVPETMARRHHIYPLYET